MVKSEYDFLNDIKYFFHRLGINDNSFFDDVVFESNIISIAGENDNNIFGYYFIGKNKDRKMKMNLPSGRSSEMKLYKLELILTCYDKFLRFKKRHNTIKFPSMFKYSALRIYAYENLSQNEIKKYNKKLLNEFEKLSDNDMIGFLMQYKIADAFILNNMYLLPIEFYTDDERISKAKEDVIEKLKSKNPPYKFSNSDIDKF